MSDTASAISSFGAFAMSSIGTFIFTVVLFYPASCSSVFPSMRCQTVLGTVPMSQADAGAAAAVLGVVVGCVCALIASSMNDKRQSA